MRQVKRDDSSNTAPKNSGNNTTRDGSNSKRRTADTNVSPPYRTSDKVGKFQSMGEMTDNNSLKRDLEMVDRSVQVDDQIVNALSKTDMALNKMKARLMRQGKPICITNFFVDKPCFIIIIGLILLLLESYYVYDRELFMQND